MSAVVGKLLANSSASVLRCRSKAGNVWPPDSSSDDKRERERERERTRMSDEI